VKFFALRGFKFVNLSRSQASAWERRFLKSSGFLFMKLELHKQLRYQARAW